MSDWPVTLPDRPVAFGFTAAQHDTLVRTSVSNGYPVTRSRGAMNAVEIDCRYYVTQAQRVILEAFYAAQGGAEPFTWTHPLTALSVTARFASELAFAPRPGGCWMVNFRLVVL